ncbi:hypothetical protein Dda_9089 [Drechslerella dactyloides]|uniref:Uncharacterized protein n=1 Tax=Drechslerella dactyloides TaxID=74499 RepID=A0AAD6NFJ4_DREDA|nr:hypothetical protein Dda_9089 [Drechslerella dactyloides]
MGRRVNGVFAHSTSYVEVASEKPFSFTVSRPESFVVSNEMLDIKLRISVALRVPLHACL